ncbi:MAG TPA: hypothetical protein VIG06_15830, partial [Kofleriaceae bacterium]
NGMNLGNGLNLGNGITGPYIAPPASSTLEKWIDADPPMRKKILRYLVECALPAYTPVQLLYRGQLETIGVGHYALGPSIESGMMTTVDQERVSACLLARVNARGEAVTIDLLGPHSGFNTASQTELDEFPFREAAFFGNLFLATPTAYTCTATAAIINTCQLRACRTAADGTCDCGVIRLVKSESSVSWGNSAHCTSVWGSYASGGANCSVVTIPGTNGFYFGACTGGGVRYAYPMTTRMVPVASGQLCAVNPECASGSCSTTTGRCN